MILRVDRASIVAAIRFALASLASPTFAQQPVTRISTDASGNQGNDQSGIFYPALSEDGRHVVFDSFASNLVSGDTNGTYDIFARDMLTGAVVRMSVDSSGNEGNDRSFMPSISADGRFVAFSSLASHLISGDTNGANDILLRDRDPDGNGIVDEGNGVTTAIRAGG